MQAAEREIRNVCAFDAKVHLNGMYGQEIDMGPVNLFILQLLQGAKGSEKGLSIRIFRIQIPAGYENTKYYMAKDK